MPNRLRAVLDTNVLLAAIPSRSPHRLILDSLFDGVYDVYLSTDILLEYDEKVAQFFDRQVAEDILGGLLLLPNVHKVDIYFNLTLIESDKDDNKFVDCAFSANVHYLVTNDRHFNVLSRYDFPRINIIKAADFVDLLNALTL